MPEFDSTIEYRDIPLWPGYKAGSDGSIWSSRPNSRWGYSWRRLNPSRMKDGYLRINLYIGQKGKRKGMLLHRVILLSFVGDPPPKMEARHFPDPCKSKCSLGNLCWGTKKQNRADQKIHGTDTSGEGSGCAKITWEQVREIRQRRQRGEQHKSIAKDFGIAANTVCNICNGNSWRTV